MPELPTLVIVYGDVNSNHVYDEGDVMISKIVDTNKDGVVSAGATIKMGQYPTSPNVIKPAQLRSQSEDWRIRAHPVAIADLDTDPDIVEVQNDIGSALYWTRLRAAKQFDEYREKNPTYEADFWEDKAAGFQDGVYTELRSPSQSTSALDAAAYDGLGDDGFIDIGFAPGV